jgi:hypothetical protein
MQGKGVSCEAGCPADNVIMTRGSDHEQTKPSGARGARLAAALRENLRRRKAQERARNAQQAPESRSPAPRDDKGR